MTTITRRASIACSSCGRSIEADEAYQLTNDRRPVCGDCAARAVAPGDGDPLAEAVHGRPATIVRTYARRDQIEAAHVLEAESRRLAESGYDLRYQTWASAERPEITGVAGVGVTLIGLFLLLFVDGGFLLGLVILLVGLALLAVYAGNLRPGVLTATFALDGRESVEPAPASGTGRPAAERLAELASLHEAGLITDDELAARRKAVLASI